MWHPCKISNHIFTIDVFSECHCKLGRMLLKNWILYYLFEWYNGTFFIRKFNAHKPHSRYWRLNTESFCLECKCEIFLQILNPRELHSFRRSKAILYNRWSHQWSAHIHINLELKKCLLNLERTCLNLERTRLYLLRRTFQMRYTWKFPSTKINLSSWKTCIIIMSWSMPNSPLIFFYNWYLNEFRLLVMRIRFYIWYTSIFLLFDLATNFLKFLFNCLFFWSLQPNIIPLNLIILIFLSSKNIQYLSIVWGILRYSRSYMRNHTTIWYS